MDAVIARDPLSIACPVCMSPVGHYCTAPTDTGRRTVLWYHWKREEERG